MEEWNKKCPKNCLVHGLWMTPNTKFCYLILALEIFKDFHYTINNFKAIFTKISTTVQCALPLFRTLSSYRIFNMKEKGALLTYDEKA